MLCRTKDIAKGSELLSCFNTRCYSVVHVVPVRVSPAADREQDRKVDLLNCGMDPEVVLVEACPGALPDVNRKAAALEESKRLLSLDEIVWCLAARQEGGGYRRACVGGCVGR